VFTAARLNIEATDALHNIVERAVVNARGGYWLKRETVTTDGVRKRYRFPYRAIAGMAEAVRLGTGAQNDSAIPSHRIFGDVVEFETAPSANQVLTWEYYLRPSRLVPIQTNGRITAIDTTAADPNVTVNVIPLRQLGSGAPANLATLGRADIVKPNGWHEVCLVNSIVIIVGSVIHFAPNTDLTDVEIGDFVRSADETDWPCLPDDFHRTLADVTAVSVLTSKKLSPAAQALATKAGPSLERLQDLLTPRVKDEPPVVMASYSMLRRGRGAGSRSFPR
jgi:hypothetical protein